MVRRRKVNWKVPNRPGRGETDLKVAKNIPEGSNSTEIKTAVENLLDVVRSKGGRVFIALYESIDHKALYASSGLSDEVISMLSVAIERASREYAQSLGSGPTN
jgi:hypothetical protein